MNQALGEPIDDAAARGMSRWRKLASWARLFTEYAGAQGMVQLLGLASGLWLVHLLPVREYALYTLALSVLAFLSVFSDLGVSSAMSYFFREVRMRGGDFAPYVRAGFALRRRLVVAGGIVGIGFMIAMARSRDFAAGEVVIVSAAIAAAVWLQVAASMQVVLLRLEARYRESYVAEVVGNATRLCAVALIWLASAPFALLALLAGAAGSIATSVIAKRRLRSGHGTASAEDPGAMRAMLRYVLPLSLGAAYFSIQSPMTVWLSAYFGATRSIAEVGALGRLGVIFSLVSGFAGAVLIPRLAGVSDERHYLRRYLQSWAALLAFGVAAVLLAAAFPAPILWLIGDSYRGLDRELVLVAMSAALGAWGAFLVAVNNARGWVRRQPIVLGAYVAIQVALIATLDLSTTRGVLLFGVYSSLAGLSLQLVVNVAGFMRALRRP